MFGLMRAKKCGMSAKEKNFRRLNYCGTCKTIGSLYSQKSRLLLNHDTVFLAEVLTILSQENAEDWQKSYQSYNCLSLPKTEIPLPLKFAATTNVILTEFKLADHISDEGKRLHKFANSAFSKEFKIAEKALNAWNFPLEKIRKTLAKQNKLEAVDPNKNLDYFAKPTAETTAIFFAQGVKLIGKTDLKNLAYEIGFEFGKLIYLLDAFEDYENDFRTNQFNAIRKSFDLETDKITPDARRKLIATFNRIENNIIEKIYELPVSKSKKQIFSSRLSDNLARKLNIKLPVLKDKKTCQPKPPFKIRWENSIETAKTFTKNYSWQMPFVFLFILAFALVAPAQSKEAKSVRECWDLSFNLMFLGSLFGSVIALVKPIFNEQDPGKIYPDLEEQKKKQQQDIHGQEETWCDTCSECDCWCDGCDGCCCECDGCGCCDCCSCDSCDCGCD